MAAPFGPRSALSAALFAALRGRHPCGVGFREKNAHLLRQLMAIFG